jgi:hypothetical protein
MPFAVFARLIANYGVRHCYYMVQPIWKPPGFLKNKLGKGLSR